MRRTKCAIAIPRSRLRMAKRYDSWDRSAVGGSRGSLGCVRVRLRLLLAFLLGSAWALFPVTVAALPNLQGGGGPTVPNCDLGISIYVKLTVQGLRLPAGTEQYSILTRSAIGISAENAKIVFERVRATEQGTLYCQKVFMPLPSFAWQVSGGAPGTPPVLADANTAERGGADRRGLPGTLQADI
jgi:hypothetical protein